MNLTAPTNLVSNFLSSFGMLFGFVSPLLELIAGILVFFFIIYRIREWVYDWRELKEEKADIRLLSGLGYHIEKVSESAKAEIKSQHETREAVRRLKSEGFEVKEPTSSAGIKVKRSQTKIEKK